MSPGPKTSDPSAHILCLITDLNHYPFELNQKLQIPFAQSAKRSPDSKRIGINYSPPHARHTSYETVAFFQLSGDKWMALPSLADDTSNRSQLTQLAHELFPKSAKPRDCAPDIDVLQLRNWTAADTAILYAPCFGRTSGQLEAGSCYSHSSLMRLGIGKSSTPTGCR